MKRKVTFIGVIVVALLLGAVAFFVAIHLYRPAEMRTDFERLSADEYNGVFVSSYSIKEYDEEVFIVNRGVPTVIAEFSMRKLEDYADYFNVAWDSGNVITNIYMGIDPFEVWQEAGENEDKWNALMDDLLIRYITAHQDVSFEILLPYVSLESWWQETDVEKKLQVYYSFVDKLDDYTNVTQYFLGGEEWLIANPQNYTETGITPELARYLSLMVFCDHDYVIASGNAEILFGRLRELLATEKVYPDYSDYAIVYFGDSIIATAHGSYSIPGIVQGLSGGNGYNMAIGGSSAAWNHEGDFSFEHVVQAFMEKNLEFQPESNFADGLKEYMEAGAEAKKQVVIINYGLNDYFSGKLLDNPEDEFDVTTYAGALRNGIKLLQEGLPGAEIVLMAPTYTIEFSAGMEDTTGQGYILTDYVAAAASVAEQMDVLFMNNYEDLGIRSDNYEEYLVDGCHPNDKGRFLFAEAIIEKLRSTGLGE